MLNDYYKDIYEKLNISTDKMKLIVDRNNYMIKSRSIDFSFKSKTVNYKYGITGIVAPWSDGEAVLVGGADQFSLPFSLKMLKDLGIVY